MGAFVAGALLLLAAACGGDGGPDGSGEFDAFFRLRLTPQLVAAPATASYQVVESQCESPLEQQVRGRISAGERKRLEGEGALLICGAVASAGPTAAGVPSADVFLSVTLYEGDRQADRALPALWQDFLDGLAATGAEVQERPLEVGAAARALSAVTGGQTSFALVFTRGPVLVLMTANSGGAVPLDFEDVGEVAALLDQELVQRSD